MIVSGTNLTMIRGDTESITVTFSSALSAGDQLTMTVRETAESPIEIQKSHICSGGETEIVFTLQHGDTSRLNFGTYVYDIQLVVGGETFITVIPMSKLRLKEEVTY